MPHMIPSDMERMQLYKPIESKATLPVAYRARHCDTITISESTTFSWLLRMKTSPEKPIYIILGFQRNNNGNQEANPSVIDQTKIYIVTSKTCMQ